MNTTERIGVSKVQLIVYEKLHWIFREQPIDDCGIDAHIELMDDNRATGKLIASQIKSGESYFRSESDNEIVYYIDEKHLNYWKSNVLPVIIVLYNPKTEECVWGYIGDIKKDNKIIINRFQKFDESAKVELVKIANIEPYKIAQINRRNYIEENKSLKLLQEMAQIENGNQKVKHKDKCQIAIDFGTTRTMIGIVSEAGEVFIIKTSEGKNFFETVIGFDENYQYFIGSDVLKRKDNPGFVVIKNFKRELGSDKTYKVFKLTFTSEDITTLYIQTIKNYIEVNYEVEINECCISLPVDFSFNQKKVYTQCIKNCNMSIVRSISESTCVTIDKKMSQSENNIIVIDMGGGTLDVSLVVTGDGVIEVLDVTGDCTIGGVDYDFALVEYIKKELKRKYTGILIDTLLKNQIIFKAEEAKVSLSTMEKVSVFFTDCYSDECNDTMLCNVEICRSEFRKITSSLNAKVEKVLNNFKERIKLNEYPQPKAVMLGGLGSKIFTVNEIIRNCFPDVKIIDLYTDKRTAEGLAVYSGKLQGFGGRDVLLIDVIGYDIILNGELLYADMPNYNAGDREINQLPSFTENEIMSELKIITKDNTIPTKRYIYIGITDNQKVSLSIMSEGGRDEVFTYNLSGIIGKTIYKISIDIDCCRCISIDMQDISSEKIICSLIL